MPPTPEETLLFKNIRNIIKGLAGTEDIKLHSDGINDSGIVGFRFKGVRYYLVASSDCIEIHAPKVPNDFVKHFKLIFPSCNFSKNGSHHKWSNLEL
jgi:hypothetical protein